MKTRTRFLVISALAVVLSGCLGDAAPTFGERGQSMNTVNANELPADLMTCDQFFGQDWDTPDVLLRVTGRPGLVVLVQSHEMVCTGYEDQVASRLKDFKLNKFMPLGGEGSDTTDLGDTDLGGGSLLQEKGDSNPLPAYPVGGDSADSPVDDSNPLPAAPVGGESASSAGPVDDSNPLPATPLGTASASSAGSAEDSNPLPAHGDGSGGVRDLPASLTE